MGVSPTNNWCDANYHAQRELLSANDFDGV